MGKKCFCLFVFAASLISLFAGAEGNINIKSGSFYQNGKYTYMLGVWSTYSLPAKLGDRRGPWSQHRIYHDAPDRAMLDELGLNCIQPNHFMTYLMMKKYFNEQLKEKVMWYGVDYFPNAEKICRQVLKRLDGLPLMMDWGDFGTHLGFGRRAAKALPREYFQKNPWWDMFMPLDPAYPPAMKLYHSSYKDSTEFILQNGGKPFIYELMNEPFYNSFSPDNLKLFNAYLSRKYASVEAMNKTWGTDYKSFSAPVAEVEKLKDTMPGLWVDWMDFQCRQVCSFMKLFKQFVLEADKRPVPKYFCFQPQHNISEMAYNNAFNMLYLDFFDVIGVEYCGLNFGDFSFDINKPVDMMEAGFKTTLPKVLFAMGVARAYATEKPVIDFEVSTARYENNLRVTSRSEDIETMLWHQVMNGMSGSMLYSFLGRNWEWKTMAQAKKNARSAHYKAHHLLNPFNFTEKGVFGLKRFHENLKQLAEIVLPMPRTVGKAGIIYLAKQTWLSKGKESQYYANWNYALAKEHLPVDFIIGEKLQKASDLQRFPILFCPQIKYCPESIRKILKEYVRLGGILICEPEAFSHNEYGLNTDATDLLGLQTVQQTFKKGKLLAGGFSNQYLPCAKLKNISAKSLINWKNSPEPAIAVNHIGKGKIYTLAFQKSSKGLGEIFRWILDQEKIKADNSLVFDKKGNEKPTVMMNAIDRGKTKFYYMLNMEFNSQIGILKPARMEAGKYYVYDAVSWKRLLPPSGETTWSTDEILRGIPVFLPSECRSLLLITPQRQKYESGVLTVNDTKSRLEKALLRELEEIKNIKLRSQLYNSDLEYKRTFQEIKPKKTFFVDLTSHVNMAFADKLAGDKQGGWFDQGNSNDLSALPVGKQLFYGVCYNIIDPKLNNGKSVIILQGRDRKYLPRGIYGIKVGKKAKALYFLHSHGWDDIHIMDYKVNYNDGSSLVIPVRKNKETSGWWNPNDLNLKNRNLRVAWTGKNKAGGNIGIFTYRWPNVHPDKIIDSIDLISKNANAIPAIIAITGVEAEGSKAVSKTSNRINILKKKFSDGIVAVAFRSERLKKSIEDGFTILDANPKPEEKWGGIIITIKKTLNLSSRQCFLNFQIKYNAVDQFGRPSLPLRLQVVLRGPGKSGKRVKHELRFKRSSFGNWQSFSLPVSGPSALCTIMFQYIGQNPQFGGIRLKDIYISNN